MKGFFSFFTDSAKEFNKIRCITVTGIFIAMYMVLEMFSFSIGHYAKINIAFIAIAIIGMLYGPVVTTFAAAMCDIVGFIAKPDGGFLIVFTLIAMIQGLVYGGFLYKREGKRLYVGIIIARVIDTILINLFLNTFALIHYGFIPSTITQKAMEFRLIKNVIEFIVYCPLLCLILPVVYLIYKKQAKTV